MNKYSIDRVVGEGSFGKALLGKRKSDNRKCIIKQISLSKMSRQEARATEQESALLARLEHPNIVSFWESFNETTRGKACLYIVMDFADGGDLSDLIKNRRNRLIPENQIINIAVQISLAMKHVHDRKILHRDLKSGNIFLTKAGVVKLGDFGIARVLRNTGELASTQIGTPYFMSPEILQNRRYNSKTDIWSLGCVFFELIALKVPFNGASMNQLVRNIVSQPPPRLNSQYSRELCNLTYSMLAKNPKERPSINSILAQPVLRNQITSILDDQIRQKEFCHTILHGDHILKKPPVNKTPLSVIREEGSVQSTKTNMSRDNQENRALDAARKRAQEQLDAAERDRKAKQQEALRKVEAMKQQKAHELRRQKMAEQAAKDLAIKKKREKEHAEKLNAIRKQEHARRQERAAQFAKQEEERNRMAQYQKAMQARQKERAAAAKAKVLEERKQYEVNRKAAQKAARPVDFSPPQPHANPSARPIIISKPQNNHVDKARYNVKSNHDHKRLNPRLKPSIPRQNIAPKSDLRIDGKGRGAQQVRSNDHMPQKQGRGVVEGKGGGRIVVVKDGHCAPSPAQLRRERFERLKAKASASHERNSENKRIENPAPVSIVKNEAEEVAQLDSNVTVDSDTDSGEDGSNNKRKGLVIAEQQWFNNLERQMGDLKGNIEQLREGRSPKAVDSPVEPKIEEIRSNKSPQIGNPLNYGAKDEKSPSGQHLASRKQKRETESKNFRSFLRAQRNAMGVPTPATPVENIGVKNKAGERKLDENFNGDVAKVQEKPSSDIPSENCADNSVVESLSAAEALRRKRDAERSEMKKMIAKKRSEKAQMVQAIEIVGFPPFDDKHSEALDTANKSIRNENRTKVKFQDFLGREYTPVTSEEDAATLGSKADPTSCLNEKKKLLTSVDDIDVQKRSTDRRGNKVSEIAASSICGELILSGAMVHGDGVQQATNDNSSDLAKEEVSGVLCDIISNDEGQVDPYVLEDLAEEIGEAWGSIENQEQGCKHIDNNLSSCESDNTSSSEQEVDTDSSHAEREFDEVLSAMKEVLKQPEGETDDDSSTFEDECDNLETHRILGTFGSDCDDCDSESLGSSWGDIQDSEGESADNSIGSSGECSDNIAPPPYVDDNDHDVTVFGLPFPIRTCQRDNEGISISTDDSPACRMEYIREFLESMLGEEKFVQAYRLLKSVDIVDEDLLLEQMETIVGTEGLRHMDIFIQLISIEEKFESL